MMNRPLPSVIPEIVISPLENVPIPDVAERVTAVPDTGVPCVSVTVAIKLDSWKIMAGLGVAWRVTNRGLGITLTVISVRSCKLPNCNVPVIVTVWLLIVAVSDATNLMTAEPEASC